jgi:hypothetical protein
VVLVTAGKGAVVAVWAVVWVVAGMVVWLVAVVEIWVVLVIRMVVVVAKDERPGAEPGPALGAVSELAGSFWGVSFPGEIIHKAAMTAKATARAEGPQI